MCNWYMLRRFEKNATFFSRLLLSIFYEMVYEMRETHGKKKVGGGTEFLWGNKSLAGGTLWDRELHTTVPPR